MKVLHVISNLEVGGAEMMLKRLVECDPASIPDTGVISLTSLGPIGESLRNRGVYVQALGLRSPFGVPRVFWRLLRLIRATRPNIVQTWMYHADLLGGFAAFLAGTRAIVWSVRSTAIPQGVLSFTYWLVRLCAICSYFVPHRVICCANSAKITHINLLYSPYKMTIIFNGYNFSALEPCINSQASARLELGFNAFDIIIGIVGRFDPLKDFHNFVCAASFVAAKRRDVKFLMIGRGNEWSNDILRGWIENAGLVKSFYLLGQQTDVAKFYSAMDIFCLSSVSEAFPNVLVEAMAMKLPCVVTRAGDAADILGNDNFVVPVRNSVSLADALLRMCDLGEVDRKILGERNAKKVREEYKIEAIKRNYDNVYNEILSK